jgi:hypothetical protein
LIGPGGAIKRITGDPALVLAFVLDAAFSPAGPPGSQLAPQ